MCGRKKVRKRKTFVKLFAVAIASIALIPLMFMFICEAFLRSPMCSGFFFKRFFSPCKVAVPQRWQGPTRSYGYAGKEASPSATSTAASDWGSLLVRRSRALALGAAHPSSGAGQACPSAVLATACCTATASMPQQRRDQPAAAARRRAGGALCDRTWSRCCTKRPASPLQRLPTSEPRTMRSCGPPLQCSGQWTVSGARLP